MTEIAVREPQIIHLVPREMPPINEVFSLEPGVGFFTAPLHFRVKSPDFQSTEPLDVVCSDRQSGGIYDSFLVSRVDGMPMGKFDSRRLWIGKIEGRGLWLPLDINLRKQGVVVPKPKGRLTHEKLKPGTIAYTGPAGTIENQETEVLDEPTRVAFLHGESHKGIISHYVEDDDGGRFWIVGVGKTNKWLRKTA